jgi:hypothetical protein
MRCATQDSRTFRRRAFVEERVRAMLDEVFVLGAAHVLAEFLAERGNRRASDAGVREIANRIDRSGGAH